VARDPFAIEGLIKALTIIEWDPLFRRLRLGVERNRSRRSCRLIGETDDGNFWGSGLQPLLAV